MGAVKAPLCNGSDVPSFRGTLEDGMYTTELRNASRIEITQRVREARLWQENLERALTSEAPMAFKKIRAIITTENGRTVLFYHWVPPAA